MIRNLKTLGDDEKQLMLLKESLQLAIKTMRPLQVHVLDINRESRLKYPLKITKL